MKPPLVNFTSFHPSRVKALRRWREKGLEEPPQKERKSKSPSRKSPDPVLPAHLQGLDAATKELVLQALRSRR